MIDIRTFSNQNTREEKHLHVGKGARVLARTADSQHLQASAIHSNSNTNSNSNSNQRHTPHEVTLQLCLQATSLCMENMTKSQRSNIV